MQLTVRRPTLTAGVALASAAVLAAGPMTQHLPKLDVAHHLPQVSVTDINLTDAASSMMDLFAGVENQLASLAGGGAAAAAVPAAALTDYINPATLPLPAATWVNLLQNAGANLQYIYNTWSNAPFPVLQQVAANWLSYGTSYVGAFHLGANAAVNFYTGSGSNNFFPLIAGAWSYLLNGNVSSAVTNLYDALFQTPLVSIGLQLFPILTIPGQIMQNATNATNYLLGAATGIGWAVNSGVLSVANVFQKSLGTGLQAIEDSFNAGDPVGLLTNVANLPGFVLNGTLNGVQSSKAFPYLSGGLFSSPESSYKVLHGTGPLYQLVYNQLPGLAKAIVAPNAQNIAAGGSLSTALQTFENTLVNGWPNLSASLGNLATQLTTMLQGVPSFLSNLPSMVGAFAGQIGTLLINLLKLL